MCGQYSTKSDVFSFGILVIEIVTGRRNNEPDFSEENEEIVSIVSTRANSQSNRFALYTCICR